MPTIKGASGQAATASYLSGSGQVVNPPGTGKKAIKRAAAAVGGGNPNAWQAAPPPKIPKGVRKGAWQAAPPPYVAPAPKGKTGTTGKGKRGQSDSRPRQRQGHPVAVPGQVPVVHAREEDLL